MAIVQFGSVSSVPVLIQMLSKRRPHSSKSSAIAAALLKTDTPEALAAVEAWKKKL